jgi:hypothetical protein
MTARKPSSVTEEQIISWFWQLDALHGELAAHERDPVERRKLGGLLLPFGPGLVMTLAQALCDKPHLFPDAPAPGPDLLACQQEANAWLALRNRLQDMARLADDAYQATQAQATHLSWTFVSRAATHAPPQIALADVPLRNLELVPALLILCAYYQAKKKTAQRNKEAAPAPQPSPAAQARARAAAQRARDRAALSRTFDQFLRARARRGRG